MSNRVRWIVLGVVLLIVLGLVALYWINANLSEVTIEGSDGRRTWIIHSGDTVTLSVDQVRPDDRYRCEGMGALVAGTPGPHRSVARAGTPLGVITVEEAADGDVTVTCEPDAALP